jgi:hypothetical protein
VEDIQSVDIVSKGGLFSKGCYFNVVHKSGRIYELWADTEADMNDWVLILKKAKVDSVSYLHLVDFAIDTLSECKATVKGTSSDRDHRGC